MNTRSKLLLAQAPLALALLAICASAIVESRRLGEHSQRFLRDNYRSVLAAERMMDADQRIDRAALLALLGQARARGEVAPARAAFEAELGIAQQNLTETGEREAVDRLSRTWGGLQPTLDQFLVDPGAELYKARLAPALLELRRTAEAILAINQDAMVQKSDQARRAAERAARTGIAAALSAILLGLLASGTLTRRILRPLATLTDAAEHLARGEREVRVEVGARDDELAALAKAFNEMAERLDRYKQSSLDELLLVQQASQAAIDSLPDPVLVFDVRGELLTVNRAAERLLDLSMDRVAPLLGVPEHLRAQIERIRDQLLGDKGAFVPKAFDEAIPVGTPEGERWLLPQATPLEAPQGLAGLTLVLQDVTRLRRFDELTHNLVATVAHEFRTPLHELMLSVHLVVEEAVGPLSPKQIELLLAAREAAERLERIVEQLLELARLESGRIELIRRAVRPEELVDVVIEERKAEAAKRAITLDREVVPSIEPISVDPERIQIVLLNLLSNALRFSPAGSRIVIRVLPIDERVRFEVRDIGPGVPAEFQERIFERFFRVPNASGASAGLGLAIAKEIVEAHGGTIGVESTPGEGAIFWFELRGASSN